MRRKVEGILRDLGAKLLEWRPTVEVQWEGTHLKADADRRAHDYLCQALDALSPGVPILSEEAPWPEIRPDTYWLIDPIDGTASYVEGYEGWVTQVALMVDGWPRASWVYAPETDELWTALEGCGARRNGTRLRVNPHAGTVIDNTPGPSPELTDAMLSLGLPWYKVSGSLGLKLCRVADGTASLFVKDVEVKDWDLAPGCLILKEAGGYLSNRAGSMIWYGGEPNIRGLIAAASHDLHTKFRIWDGGR